MYALAAGTHPDAVKITACPSTSPGVHIDTTAPYDAEFEDAVHTAYSLFLSRHGPFLHGYDITVHSSLPLSGASVGTPVYAALFLSLSGGEYNVGLSGELSADGFVLPVASVEEKASVFAGPVVLPAGSCVPRASCVSDVGDLEAVLKTFIYQ